MSSRSTGSSAGAGLGDSALGLSSPGFSCPSDQPGKAVTAKRIASAIPHKDTLPETLSDRIIHNLLSKEEGVPVLTAKTGAGIPDLQPAENSNSSSAYSRRLSGSVPIASASQAISAVS